MAISTISVLNDDALANQFQIIIPSHVGQIDPTGEKTRVDIEFLSSSNSAIIFPFSIDQTRIEFLSVLKAKYWPLLEKVKLFTYSP